MKKRSPSDCQNWKISKENFYALKSRDSSINYENVTILQFVNLRKKNVVSFVATYVNVNLLFSDVLWLKL